MLQQILPANQSKEENPNRHPSGLVRLKLVIYCVIENPIVYHVILPSTLGFLLGLVSRWVCSVCYVPFLSVPYLESYSKILFSGLVLEDQVS
jgi:hypothetical protein